MDIDVDPFDDITGEAANNAKGTSKFQPKAKFRPGRKPVAPASLSKSQPQSTPENVPTATETVNASNNLAPGENRGQNISTEKSVGMTSELFIGLEKHVDFRPDATNLEANIPPSESVVVNDSGLRGLGTGEADALNLGESLASSCVGYSKTDIQELTTGEMEVLRSVCLKESASDSGRIAGGFQIGLDVRMREETCEATEPISCSPNPYEINEAVKDSISTLQQDDVLDLSALGFTDLLTGEDVMGYDSGHANDRVWNEEERLDHSQEQIASAGPQDKEIVGSLRRKSQPIRLVDELDDEVLASLEVSGECLPRIVEEGNSIDTEYQLENEENRKSIHSSTKHANDKGLTAAKRKKPDEATPVTNQKPKRFPHSTRRRRVNKALLEIPEEEIDYQNIPLRDIILLAEHKEKQMKKEQAETGVSQIRNSENGASRVEGENPDAQENPDLRDTTLYFNYQTYMNKPRTIQWSKRDTELFYEAVQQFGTDFSMIQQLFPELTRHQIKLKYKKEEKRHPMRLQQALSSRSKDHFHFKNVIERLKKVAAEENRHAEKEDSEMEERSFSQANDEEANEEENEGENGYAVPSEVLSKEEGQEEEALEADEDYFQYTSL